MRGVAPDVGQTGLVVIINRIIPHLETPGVPDRHRDSSLWWGFYEYWSVCACVESRTWALFWKQQHDNRTSSLMEECTMLPLPRLERGFLVALPWETFTNNTSCDCTSSVFWPIPLKWVPCGRRSTHSQLAPWKPSGNTTECEKEWNRSVFVSWSEGRETL